eukprot:1163783-Pleurochrysis_carterae.AAC.3
MSPKHATILSGGMYPFAQSAVAFAFASPSFRYSRISSFALHRHGGLSAAHSKGVITQFQQAIAEVMRTVFTPATAIWLTCSLRVRDPESLLGACSLGSHETSGSRLQESQGAHRILPRQEDLICGPVPRARTTIAPQERPEEGRRQRRVRGQHCGDPLQRAAPA